MKTILKYHTWTNGIPVRESILTDIQKYQPVHIKIFSLEENEFDNDWEIFLQSKLLNNIKIEIFLGAISDHSKCKNLNNVTFYSWPYFFLFYTFATDIMEHYTHSLDLKIEKSFISLNNNPRYHRCLLVDMLSKNNLLESGNFSWNNIPLNNEYVWQWWNPKITTLTDQFLKTFFQYELPKEWNESFVNLVSETSVTDKFITEKTWIPILCKKPFLVQSCVGFYKYFQSLGFKIYDEIFDYGFDDIEDLELRTQFVLDNLKNISNKNYQKLYKIIQPKVEYNFDRSIELLQDKSIIPKFIIDDSFAKEKYLVFIEQSRLLLSEKYLKSNEK